MKNNEFKDISDLTNLMIIQEILDQCFCVDDPNKTRLKSVRENIRLMINHIDIVIEDTP